MIAHEVEALRVGRPLGHPLKVGRTPGRRRDLSRSHTAVASGSEGGRSAGVATVRESPDDLDDFQTSLPDPLEHWADPEHPAPSPFRYLTALRQSPPGIKSFG